MTKRKHDSHSQYDADRDVAAEGQRAHVSEPVETLPAPVEQLMPEDWRPLPGSESVLTHTQAQNDAAVRASFEAGAASAAPAPEMVAHFNFAALKPTRCSHGMLAFYGSVMGGALRGGLKCVRCGVEVPRKS